MIANCSSPRGLTEAEEAQPRQRRRRGVRRVQPRRRAAADGEPARRRGIVLAALPSGRVGLDARPARRRAREPGREHERDRHNVGFMVVDELARRHGGSFKAKFSGHLAEVRVGDARLALLKPETYMNDSGRSVSRPSRFYKVPARARCSSSTTRSTWTPAGCRPGSAAASPGTTGCARSPAPRRPGLPPPAGRRRAARPRRPARRRRLRPLAVRARGRRRGDRRRAADAVESLVADGLEETQRRFN